MSHLFLCHSHQDKLFVKRLANDLQRYHHNVWIDEAEIKIGDSLLQKIADAITKVDYVIAIISDDSKNSEWVEKELDIAMTREINEKRVVVLPIILTQKGLPNFLLGKFYADFSDESKYYKSLLLFLKTITNQTSLKENTNLINALKIEVCQRIYLSSSKLVDIFAHLKTLILGNDIEHLLEGIVPMKKNESELWDKCVCEGYISACMCFLSFHHTVFLPDIEDASAQEAIIALTMGIHEGDIRKSARLNEETVSRDINHYHEYYEEWNKYNLQLKDETRDVLLKFCPTGETQKFYLGWHYFCVTLFCSIIDAISQKSIYSTNDYVGYAIKNILAVIHTFEFDYDYVGFRFWYIVYLHILRFLGGQKIDSILDDVFGASQFVEGNEQEFINELEKELEITVELKNSWTKTLKRIKQPIQASAIAWIDLRSKYEFYGYGDHEHLKIAVTKRYF